MPNPLPHLPDVKDTLALERYLQLIVDKIGVLYKRIETLEGAK